MYPYGHLVKYVEILLKTAEMLDKKESEIIHPSDDSIKKRIKKNLAKKHGEN